MSKHRDQISPFPRPARAPVKQLSGYWPSDYRTLPPEPRPEKPSSRMQGRADFTVGDEALNAALHELWTRAKPDPADQVIIYGPAFVGAIAKHFNLMPQEAFDLIRNTYPKGEYVGEVVEPILFDPDVSPST